MKDIPAIKGRYYITRLVEEGEHEHQDFKFLISDARKIARSISAFANNDGGHLLIGVKDNGVIAGVRNEEDIYMIETAASSFCRPEVTVEFKAFKVDPGVMVVKAEIPKSERRPVRVVEQGGELKAYFRVKDENIVAHPLMLRAWEYERDENRSAITLTQSHNDILNLIAGEGSVEIDSIWRNLHISAESAADTVARMVASRLLVLNYSDGKLVISLNED